MLAVTVCLLLVYVLEQYSVLNIQKYIIYRAVSKIKRDILGVPERRKKALQYFVELDPPPILPREPVADGKIFVSIASYRDPELVPTVADLLKKAAEPRKIVLCICIQDIEPDRTREDLQRVCTDKCELRIITMSHLEARGPTWARYLIQTQWRGEQYFLQIDSHMRFTPMWDVAVVDCLGRCPGDKVCLTNYVAMYNIRSGAINPAKTLRGGLLVSGIDKKDGFMRFNSPFVPRMRRPQKTWCWSACFSFSSSSLILDAPYDPFTPYLFFGEENDIAARLHHHGWALYAPDTPICFTTFVRSYRHTYWKDHPNATIVEPLSRLRIYHRMGMATAPNELLRNTLPLGRKAYEDYVSKIY